MESLKPELLCWFVLSAISEQHKEKSMGSGIFNLLSVAETSVPKKQRKAPIYLLLLIVVFLLGFSISPYAKNLKKAPNILLPDLNGKLFNLSKVKYNNLLLVSFSATYCKPCKKEIKEFEKIVDKFGTDKIKVFIIFVDKKVDKIKSYVKRNNIQVPVLHDKYGIVSRKYNIKALPTVFLLNKKREIIYSARGFNKNNIKKIVSFLKSSKRASRNDKK